MKILLTTDTVGGVWSYALELARGLQRHQVEVVLATMGNLLTPAQRVEAASIAGLQLCESQYRLEWMQDPWDDVQRAGEWLLSLEAEHRPDLVHLNGYAHGVLPWRVPVVMAAHSCVLSWWQAVRGEPAPPEWDLYRREVASGLRAADCVVAPTAAMLDAADRYYGPFPLSKVIPNGRDPRRYEPVPKEPVVLAAGRIWDEAKNIGALGAVAEALPWPVYVAGEDCHPEGGRAEYPGLRPLGKLAPHILADWQGRAAIYALPARYEPFGLSILEAALAGCALVLGDIPSLREVWGDTALYVQPEDHTGLRDTLRRLIGNPEVRVQLTRRSRRRALMYTTEQMVERYLELYRTLLEEDTAIRRSEKEPFECAL